LIQLDPGPKEAQNDGSSPQNRGTGTGSPSTVQRHSWAPLPGSEGQKGRIQGAFGVFGDCFSPRQMDPDGPGILDDGPMDVRWKAQSPEESDAGSDSAEAAPANSIH